mmetsp:Transcript_36521/g.56064  ORF Transcript_36521/g.56064 Transcript_36521/m.56064 type:complete len:268 (+) Transcript_36521:1310-2113(+)
MGAEVIHRSELDQFKLDILEKINRRFMDFDKKPESLSYKPIKTELPQAATEAMGDATTKDEPLKKRSRVNSGQIQFKDSTCSEHSTSTPAAESEQVLTLKRDSGDFKSKGCMLLAVVFGMMCCSSYIGGSLPDAQIPTSQVEQIPVSNNVRDLKSVKNESDIISSMTHMTLQGSSVDDEMVPDEELEETENRSMSLREIARSMKNLGSSVDLKKIMQSMQGPHSALLRQIVAGEYNYLAYLMCSAVCCYYWMSPSQQTLRMMRGRGR